MTGSHKPKIRVGSRGSRLALKQLEEVFALLHKEGHPLPYQLRIYETQGDKDKVTPLTANAVDDFFTDTLDEALLKGEIEIAVHSAKDVPQKMREGLKIFALTESLDETDCLVGQARLAELPQGSRVATSSALRQEMVKALRSDLEVVDIRGNIEERLEKIGKGEVDAVIVATCAMKRLGMEERIKEILPWEATPLQGQLAVVGCEGDSLLENIFRSIDVRLSYGRVWLVGAGPGDPDLITVSAIKILQKADCVFYDYLVHKGLLDYFPQAEPFYVGKRKGQSVLPQAELNRMLRQKAMAGKKVVRLKGGDPLIFGRGADEIQYLRQYHIDVEIIPGISSATGIPSLLGIPLTARGLSSSVAFVSGHGEGEKDAEQYPIRIPQVDTLIFLMGLTKLGDIVRSLKEAGWNHKTPMIVISKGTRIDETIVTGCLDNIETLVAQQKLDPPALIMAGKTVQFFNARAGSRKNILYLGTHPEKYKSLGHIVPHPMIEIQPAVVSPKESEEIRHQLDKYDFLLFTSPYGVKHFFRILDEAGVPDERLLRIQVLVIGEETAWTFQHHLRRPDLISEEENSEGFLKAILNTYAVSGKRFLFPRSSLPNPLLKEALTQQGAWVKEIVVYQNRKPVKRELPAVKIDAVLFTSPSGVKNFIEHYGSIPSAWQILARGPRTQLALKEAGYLSEVVVVD